MSKDTTLDTLKEALTGAGLSETEIRVFTFLLQHEAGLRVSDIARRTRLNRTTLYGILNSLTEKGIVTSSEERGVLRFQSIHPRSLVDYLERAQERLARNAKKVADIIPDITRIREQEEQYRPKMRFFDGSEGIKQAYEDLVRENKEKLVYGFTGIHAIYNLMGMDWIDYILKRRPSAGVKWLALAVDSAKSREMSVYDKEQLRVTKFLPKEFDFDIELAAYDDKMFIVSYAEDHPWAMIITDQRIADTIKALFRYIDSTLPEKTT
ncbi:helix-turn-helix domain-containing protein [Patescibacteria group bacterium]|nr:helix-turn-helix domain-containing protein [Patescibacteria group bacterium]